MLESTYNHQIGDEEIILQHLRVFRNLSDAQILRISSDIKSEVKNIDHQTALYFISLYYEVKSRNLNGDLQIERGILKVKVNSTTTSMKDFLIQKGVKLKPKSGSFVMPVSSSLVNMMGYYDNKEV